MLSRNDCGKDPVSLRHNIQLHTITITNERMINMPYKYWNLGNYNTTKLFKEFIDKTLVASVIHKTLLQYKT